MKELTFNQELKTKWVGIMQAHQDMDRLIQGSWLQDDDNEIHSGCFFGCAMQTDNDPLGKAIDAMNLPEWLIYLSERIFEGLPKKEAILFPVQLLKAIPENTDIESARHNLAIKRLESLIKHGNGDQVNNAINAAISYHKTPSESAESAAWSAAESAAWSAWSARSAAESAAESAAWSAAESAAWSARSARSAAESAAWSARSAAESAAWSARSAARSAAWSQERDWLIEILTSFKE